MREGLMNEAEAAGLLGLSRCTLQSWRYHGRGPDFLRLGRAIRYSRDDLMAWMERGRVCAEG